MGNTVLDDKINSFIRRKDLEFPDAFAGRHESRTVKYAANLRASGQLLFTR